MGFFDKVKGALGFDKAGGRKDAFKDFQKFGNEIGDQFNQSIGNIQGLHSFNKNPLLEDDLQGRFGEVRGIVEGQRTALDLLPQQLEASALARSASPQVAALQAARISGGGRSGLAFGGGSSALARRAAQEAAVGQSAALADALVQGTSARAGFLQQNTQQRLGLEGALTQGLGLQGQFTEQRIGRLAGAHLQRAGSRASLAGVALGGGLQGDQAAAGRRFDFMQSLRTGQSGGGGDGGSALSAMFGG